MNKRNVAGFKMVSAALALGLLFTAPVPVQAEEAKTGSAKLDFSDLQRLAQNDSSFARQILVLAAQQYQRTKEPKKSVEMYKQALVYFPSDMQLTEDMANAQLSGGDIQGGLASWKQILERQGKDVGTRIRYANYLDQAKQGEKAIGVMQELVKERPDDSSLRYWISDSYVRQGKPGEAEKELKGMLKQFPKEASEIQRRIDLLKPPAPPAPAPAPPKAAPAPAVPAPAPAAPTKVSVAAPAQASQSKVEEKIKKTEKNKKSEKKKGWI